MMRVVFNRWLLTAMLLGLLSSDILPGVFGEDSNMTDTDPMEEEGEMDMNVTETEAETDMDGMEEEETDMDGMEDDMGGMNMTAPTLAPTAPTFPPSKEGGCYDNLDAIFFLISDDDKLFQQKTFIICPGSVMEVGFLVPGVGIDQGQAPIIPRSNTEFLCGEDGKSENNCIIKGGDFGLIAVPVFFRQDLSVNNVQIKGFTFEGQVQYAAFVASSGDITFEDCIFRDSANFGPMVYNYDSSLDLNRRLEDEEEFDNKWDAVHDYVTRYRAGTLPKRRLEEEADVEDPALLPGADRDLQEKVHEGLIKDCLFSNLQQVERKLGVEFGIITIKGPDHDITVEDTTFANCEYGNQELTPIGYGILVQGAELTLNRNCFVDNDFRGNGVILLEQTASPFENDFLVGNYATEDEDLDCSFAAWFETDEDRRDSNFQCFGVQTDSCGGEPISTPPGGSSSGGGGATDGDSGGEASTPAPAPADVSGAATTATTSSLFLWSGLVAMVGLLIALP